MYFTNITDDELKPFHKMFGADFHISLTNLLKSKLFKVETVITDKLYRVYPLFYCKEVISNNPEDKVSNVQCLILTRMEHESYLSFRTNNINPSNLDDSYFDIKQIGDKLTVAEFNSLVYRIRKNTRLNNALKFDNENHHITDNDIQTTLKLQGIYEQGIIKGIKLTGDANKPIDNTCVNNKTFHIYGYDGAEWKFIKSIDTNSNGEYSFTDYSVNSFIDDSETGTQTELQSLIDNAIQSGETEITLEKQYKFTSRNPIIINNSLKINGNGHIIEGDNKSRLFDITGDNVTLTNLILLNGNSGTTDGDGGAIKWTGDNGVLSNTVIANCISNTNGGAVYWTGDNGEIRNCRFVHNATNGNGGALYLESSVKFTSIDVVSFNNFANGDGGCVYATGGNQYWKNWIINKDTTNGGTRSTFKTNGDTIHIESFNVSDPYYGRNFTDYTTHAVNNKLQYKIIPSTWVTDREDYSINNSFNLLSKTSTTSKGTSQGLTRLTGLYGDYHFINSHRLNNNRGLIINESLKQNPLKVKLVNPYFRFANYNLTFTVMSITGANIFEDDIVNNITTDSFTVLLEKNKEVIVDVSKYTNDSILFFNVDASIDFNRHEIIYPPSLRLASNKESIKLNESITLTCKYTDDENKPVTGALITFKESNTSIGTSITNNEGIATITYVPQGFNDCSFIASCNDILSNTVTVDVQTFDGMTLTSDKDILSYNGGDNPDIATLTAQLTAGGEPVAVSGELVTFEVRKQSDDSLIETLTGVTDGTGKCSVSYTSKHAGLLYIKSFLGSVEQSINLEDTFYYNPLITTTSVLSIPNFPINFKTSFKIKRASSGSSGAWLEVGQNVDNCILIGNTSSEGSFGIFIRQNGSYTAQKMSDNEVLIRNTETLIEYSLNNGVHTIKANNITLTLNNSNITSRDYIRGFILNNMIKDLIIYEL